MTPYLIYLFLAYMVGSIPFGVLAAKILGKGPIFEPGERNPKHAGDVFKILGNKLGVIVTILDFGKGLFVVWPLITILLGEPGHITWWVVSLGGLFVVIGHCNSAVLGFRGGRGLATSFGVLFPILPFPAIGACLVWAALSFWGLSTRPGALSAAGAMPFFSIPYCLYYPEKLFYLYAVAFLSLWTMWEHRATLAKYLGMAKIQRSNTAPDVDSPPPKSISGA